MLHLVEQIWWWIIGYAGRHFRVVNMVHFCWCSMVVCWWERSIHWRGIVPQIRIDRRRRCVHVGAYFWQQNGYWRRDESLNNRGVGWWLWLWIGSLCFGLMPMCLMWRPWCNLWLWNIKGGRWQSIEVGGCHCDLGVERNWVLGIIVDGCRILVSSMYGGQVVIVKPVDDWISWGCV